MENKEKHSLLEEVAACKKELFNMTLSASSGQLKDYSQFKKVRKKVARLLTQVNTQHKG